MPIITIYQGASAEGQEVAETVAQALGYRCVGREVLVAASRRYGIPEARLNEIVEKGPPWWERLVRDLRPYKIALQATLCELARDGKVVYHGHLGHELLSGIGHVLKVLLTAPIEYRIEQVRSRQSLTEIAAHPLTISKRSIRPAAVASWRCSARIGAILIATTLFSI